MKHHPTAEQIEAAKTANGGWTREQLKEWGVPWPLPKGWKATLLQRANKRTSIKREAT